MGQRKTQKRKPETQIAVIDFETDPFLYGRVPKPFAAGFYSEETGFKEFWGARCVQDLLQFLDDLKTPFLIYAHNGGKFDFFFLLPELENPVRIINGRIVSAKLGIHELRDSYAIIPVPLAAYKKTEIDYDKFEIENREDHYAEIVSYLRDDCVDLHTLVRGFISRFGPRLTIGGTAIKILREMHPFESQRENHDQKFRPYYFGGRVENFESGIKTGRFRVYDVNSMYPFVMREFDHPTGSSYRVQYGGIVDKHGRISGIANAKFYFAKIHCKQSGAFPVREKNKPLNFNIPEGEFCVTSHELKAAIETGRAWDIKVIEVHVPLETIRFVDYVDKFSAEKIAAKLAKDKPAEIFAKLLLNSAYGKFAQNPDHYFDYEIHPENSDIEESEWELYRAEPGEPSIWRRPSQRKAYYDVATAASITGAARAVLMRALSAATRPVYCDTDSIICESLDSDLHDSRLGAWKLEGEGNKIAIGGKKLYALRNGREYVKIASKGAQLTGKQIFDMAGGKVIHWKNDAPTFSLSKGASFVDRKIQSRV